MAIKITAVTKTGNDLASAYIHPEETLSTVLNIMSDQLIKSEVLLDLWVIGGRTIKCEREV